MSVISEEQVKEIIESDLRNERVKYNLSAKNAGAGVTELAPFYILKGVDFNKNTRNATLTFEQHVNTRTISGGGAPIYSGWKTRKKAITKSIKLTDIQLENLIENEDPLIKKFAKEIVFRLGEEFYPSWFIKDILYTLYKNEAAETDAECARAVDEAQQDIYNTNANISKILTDINGKKAEITLKQAEITNIEQQIEKTESKFFHTQKGINRLIESKENTQNAVRNLEAAVENLQKIVQNLRDRVERKESIIKTKNLEAEESKNRAFLEYYEKRKAVLPLQAPTDEEGFMPLKSFAGREYQPIVGCYILRNTQNKRCYVGQSRDVFKRIRQHFKGTTPNNIIFAEDYYNSEMQNKEDMFEYKIIPCEEDDLNRTERELIEKYDAHTHGYNQTAGNSD